VPEKYVAQYKYEYDNCVYFLKVKIGGMQKPRDIKIPKELPAEVRRYFGKIAEALMEEPQ
jgi:hypothetical protein